MIDDMLTIRIKQIILNIFLGNIISDDDLEVIQQVKNKESIWDLLNKELRKLESEKENIIFNPDKQINYIFNMQLIYWTISECEITSDKRKKFYDALVDEDVKRKKGQ